MDATRQALIDAIYGQESSSGKADTSKENYAGARGPMQVTRSTFDALKNKGIIPDEYRHDNPEQSKAAGVALVNYLADKYDNDPTKVAAAYYAGEKAVRPDGTIADFRDLKNPKAPTTHQYVQQILSRMGGDAPDLGDGGLAPNGDPVAVAGKANVLDAWTGGFGTRPDKIGRLGAVGPAVPAVADTALPQGPGTSFADMVSEGARNQRQAQTVQDTGFIDSSRALFMHSGFLGNALKLVARDSFGAPEPGFKIDPKEYDGTTHAEQAALSEAYNAKSLERIKWEITQRRADEEEGNRNGPWVGVAAAIMGSLPEGYVTGAAGALGAMKATAMLGVRTRAGLLAASAAENVGVNVALTAAQSAIDPYTGLEDAPMAVGMGLIGTALHLPGLGRAADHAQVKFQAQKIMDSAAEHAVLMENRAKANLGEGASREQMQAEINRLHIQDAQAKVSAATSPVPVERRLLPEEVAEPHAEATAAAASDRPLNSSKDVQEFGDTVRPLYDDPEILKRRAFMAENDDSWKAQIHTLSDGEFSFARAKELPAGVHVSSLAAADVRLKPAIEAAQALAARALPGDVVVIGTRPSSAGASGQIISAGNVHFIAVDGAGGQTAALRTATHEIGHAVLHKWAKDIPAPLMAQLRQDHASFLDALRAGDLDTAANRRFGLTSASRDASAEGLTKAQNKKYIGSFDEYTAEQFVKFVETKASTGEGKALGFTDKIVKQIKDAISAALDFFRTAKRQGAIEADESFANFFQGALDGNLRQVAATAEPKYLDSNLVLPEMSNLSRGVPTFTPPDAIATKYGIDHMPQATPQQRAEYKAVRHLYEKADAWAVANPKDETKLSKLMGSSLFKNGESITATMLRSDNPVVRMIASELMESASGAGGRRATAAIAKHLNERAYVGNVVNEFQGAYSVWRREQGGTVIDDFTNGKLWHQFNRTVAEEIENRKAGKAGTDVHPAVADAANRMEAAYERMRQAQIGAKTVGWAALPETSVGYMPHRLSSEKVRQLTNAEKGALHSALVDQFVSIEGFDISFSANLASKYIDRIQRRALGGTEAVGNIHQTGAADVVQEALEQMGMTKVEVDAAMGRYMKGAAGHTKQRLKLDLNRAYEDGLGGSFRLLDLFETDQLNLVRSQAGRVSGEVALAGHGVMGKPGLALLRRAMEFGETGGKAQGHELEAFDQMAAEMLGDPFGTAHSAKWMNRAMQVTSLARLGGMGFTQLAESINAIAHVGASRALAMVGGLNRLRREAAALARGEEVYNPILRSIEKFSMVDFGTDNRKMVFPFDNQSLQYQSYGKDTLQMGDRLLRGATHLQGKLSLWQAIHGAQQRGTAEQIVSKAMEYIRAGKNDVALRDMGISDDLAGRLRKDLDSACVFEGEKLSSFDITKFKDVQSASEFVQAVHRGSSQIIQDTFIGERGKWAHDATARLFTQFRTFSLTSVEKQWGRQVNNHGTAKALGILLGSMSVAAPLYIARTYAASAGRHDQQDYLDRQLTPYMIARATMNYVAASGLAGDLLDATTAVVGGQTTGGRSGAAKGFVGNVIAPSAGLIDDAWKSIQNTKNGTDPHDFVKVLPFSNHPLLIPAINALGTP